MCLMHGKHRIKFLRGVQQVIKLKKIEVPCNHRQNRKPLSVKFPESTCSSTERKWKNKISTKLKILIQNQWLGFGVFLGEGEVFFILNRRAILSCWNRQ